MVADDILGILHSVVHPETGSDIVTLGMVENLTVSPDKIQFTLHFTKSRDPFANSIKKQCEQQIGNAFPQYAGKITVFIKEAAPKKTAEKPEKKSLTGEIGNIVAVSSAKGGVGKSTVTANLAVALARMGYRVGILDADIYGPSQPTMFGVEDYQPAAVKEDGADRIVPAESHGVELMSIGFFINPTDALIWRGPMATSALRQMIHDTLWGGLDYLLVDLPPGTGDVHLSLVSELKLTAAIIVSTPQKVALADVERGIHMFQAEKIGVPVLGIVENMAWFTPAELPGNKYYIFGQGGAKALAERENLPVLGEIPLIQSVREAADNGEPIAAENSPAAAFYTDLAEQVVEKLKTVGR